MSSEVASLSYDDHPLPILSASRVRTRLPLVSPHTIAHVMRVLQREEREVRGQETRRQKRFELLYT
jgi:hypothetical protein